MANIMRCCQCKTNFVEEHRYADFYLELIPGGIVSPAPVLPAYCKWRFEHDKPSDPPKKINVYTDQLAYRQLFSGPTSSCNCTDASGGKAGDSSNYKNEEFTSGYVTRSFPGRIVITQGNCYGGRAVAKYQYEKILKIKYYDIDYENDHLCGNYCPGAPWPQNRKLDQIGYWKTLAKNYS